MFKKYLTNSRRKKRKQKTVIIKIFISCKICLKNFSHKNFYDCHKIYFHNGFQCRCVCVTVSM